MVPHRTACPLLALNLPSYRAEVAKRRTRTTRPLHADLRAQGIRVLVARPKLLRDYSERNGLRACVGRENVFPSIRAAVETILLQQDRERADEDPGGAPPDRSYRAFFESQMSDATLPP
jgi:hypothetical protein